MKHDDFESMCEALYALSKEQRECLLDLLQSRIWIYQPDKDTELDNCQECDEDYIKIYLDKCPQEFVTFVMKKRPEGLRKWFSKLMSDRTPVEFERIYEYDNDSIKVILKKISMVSLGYALKGGSDELRHKFSKNMSKAKAAQLKNEMEELGPVRVTSVLIAQGLILDSINVLASKSKIELPLTFDTIVSKANLLPQSVANNDDRLLQARILFTLNDDYLRMLIREIESACWVDFLWYLNDVRFSSKVLFLSSPHFANKLIRDWADRWENVKLKSASETQLEIGRNAMQKVMGTFHQMVDSGQIQIPKA